MQAAHFWGHNAPYSDFYALPRDERITMIAYSQASSMIDALVTWEQAQRMKAKGGK